MNCSKNLLQCKIVALLPGMLLDKEEVEESSQVVYEQSHVV